MAVCIYQSTPSKYIPKDQYNKINCTLEAKSKKVQNMYINDCSYIYSQRYLKAVYLFLDRLLQRTQTHIFPSTSSIVDRIRGNVIFSKISKHTKVSLVPGIFLEKNRKRSLSCRGYLKTYTTTTQSAHTFLKIKYPKVSTMGTDFFEILRDNLDDL